MQALYRCFADEAQFAKIADDLRDKHNELMEGEHDDLIILKGLRDAAILRVLPKVRPLSGVGFRSLRGIVSRRRSAAQAQWEFARAGIGVGVGALQGADLGLVCAASPGDPERVLPADDLLEG